MAIFGGILLLSGVGSLLIARYYRDHYGRVTPTRSRQVRHAAAVVAWIVVLFVGANKHLLYSPGGRLVSSPPRSPSRCWSITRSWSGCERTTS